MSLGAMALGSPKVVIALLAAAFAAVGVGILRKQAAARSCPLHRPAAGRAAVLVALLLFAASLALVGYIWLL